MRKHWGKQEHSFLVLLLVREKNVFLLPSPGGGRAGCRDSRSIRCSLTVWGGQKETRKHPEEPEMRAARSHSPQARNAAEANSCPRPPQCPGLPTARLLAGGCAPGRLSAARLRGGVCGAGGGSSALRAAAGRGKAAAAAAVAPGHRSRSGRKEAASAAAAACQPLSPREPATPVCWRGGSVFIF